MKRTSIPDLLRTAADILGQRGWCQRADIHPDGGGVCAHGALRLAAGQEPMQSPFIGMWRITAPLEWTSHDFNGYRYAIITAHRLLDEFMRHRYGPDFARMVTGMPSVIFYNDKVATDVASVQNVLRKCADWIESHPEAELRAAALPLEWGKPEGALASV